MFEMFQLLEVERVQLNCPQSYYNKKYNKVDLALLKRDLIKSQIGWIFKSKAN